LIKWHTTVQTERLLFLDKPVLPENYEEDTWKKLEEAVSAIHR